MGKNISMRPYITDENLAKLEQIKEVLNNCDDVRYGAIERWEDSDIFTMMINDAIENFNLQMGKSKREKRC